MGLGTEIMQPAIRSDGSKWGGDKWGAHEERKMHVQRKRVLFRIPCGVSELSALRFVWVPLRSGDHLLVRRSRKIREG